MFSKVEIKNFRSINYLKMEDLGRVNLLVGRNNCGKTSILEALFLLIGISSPLLINKINYFRESVRQIKIDANKNVQLVIPGGVEILGYIFKELDFNCPVELKAENKTETRELKITGEYSRETGEESIASGNISSKQISGVKYDFKVNNNNYISSAYVTPGQENYKFNFNDKYSEKLKGVFKSSELILKSSELVPQLEDIIKDKLENKIIEILKQMEPNLTGIYFGSDNKILIDLGGPKRLPLHVMGDGFRRLLSIILPFSKTTKDGILLIDEIENGFHYSSLKTVWQAIFAAAKEYNVQVFLTTHSYECINAFASFADEDDNIRLHRIEKKENEVLAFTSDIETLKFGIEKNFEVR